MRRGKRIGAVWLILAIFGFASPPARAAPLTREEAVTIAREGKPEVAIRALRDLLEADPPDRFVAYDLAVILTWVGRRDEAIDAFERAEGDEPPEYVLGPIIRAYRDEKRFEAAERWARVAVQLYPLNSAGAKLLGLVLADQGKTKEALTVLEPWAAAQPDDPEVWLALGYAALRGSDRFGALRGYGQAVRIAPGDREAQDAMAALLTDLGAPTAAAGYQQPPALSIQANQAAELLRWGKDVPALDPRQRFTGTDRAIARLESLLAKGRAAPNPNRALILRLRYDRLLALRNRERWKDVVLETERLRAEGRAIPLYVREAEADALLALRRPREARRGYEDVLRSTPGHRGAQIGRFFALVEEENFTAAFQQIDDLADREKPGIREPQQRSTQPNTNWLDAKMLSAQARSFADMPAVAWEMILPLAEHAPANAELRRVLGNIAAGREWPRRSAQETEIAASLSPDDKHTQVALAESAIRRRNWAHARSRIGDLAAVYPDDIHVRAVQIELRSHDAFRVESEIRVNHEHGGGSGDAEATNSPGSGMDWISRVYSPPLVERVRVIAAWEHHTADVTEGKALRERSGVGVELALPDLTLELMGWNNEGDISDLGASLALAWIPSDHWRFDLGAEIFAGATPLRAVLNNITANAANFGVTYTWHESQSLAAGIGGYDFSDGNQRFQAQLTFTRKIVDRPHLDVALRSEVYSSTNSSNEGPYFSPLSDLSWSIACDAEHVLWRRYDRSFGHRLALTAGAYWQELYDTGWIGSVLYEQVFNYEPWGSFRYGLQCRRAIYDGDPTYSTEAFVRVQLRF